MYIPFAPDHRRGWELGRHSHRPVGCHAQVIQVPSVALVQELGQASLALSLASLPLARRTGSQARSLQGSGYLTINSWGDRIQAKTVRNPMSKDKGLVSGL